MGPGSIVGDKYRVGRQIGRGGMGVIVEATHVQLGTQVAIKILRANPSEKPEVAERFLREARAAAQLKSEHICRVHDYGTLPDQAPFMVMELLEGRDLGTLVDTEGPLDYKLVAHYLLQACVGLAEAHARGLIHRDLKPGNLFLETRADGTPFIKILDFGIAKYESADFKLTDTQSVVGSPYYMAPEQLRSSKLVDVRTDIWGLGVVMYELLTEHLPFTGESIPELVFAITSEPPPPIPGGVIPAAMIDLVYKCLDKTPDDRFQTVGELAEALALFAELDRKQLAELTSAMLAQRPQAASRAERVVDELLAKETTVRTATGAIEGASPPRARLAIALVLAAAAGLGVAGWLVLGRGSGEDEPTVPPHPTNVPIGALPADAGRPDAVPLDASVDAAVPDAEPAPDAGAPAEVPVVKKKRPHKRPGTRTPPEPVDLGKSRY